MPPNCPLELDYRRRAAGGCAEDLAAAISRGADLRVLTEFRHNEHIDLDSENSEPVLEVAHFGITYLLDDRWSAGIMNLRQPVALPGGFGERPSMSFFIYNQDGRQAIARPYLDGRSLGGSPGGLCPPSPEPGMFRYHIDDSYDGDTNAPSHNFVYDFDVFRYLVADDWTEVLAHDAEGRVAGGSLAALVEAFTAGRALKVGVSWLATSLIDAGPVMRHEVFVEVGSAYYYTEQQLFIAGTHPLVRVRPNIPLRYESRTWDFGWLLVRSDGHVVYRRCDPYTLQFADLPLHLPVRWFVR